MAEVQEAVRAAVRRLLEEGAVGTVLAHQDGFDPLHPVPLFARRPDQADRVEVGPFDAGSLAKYLLRLQGEEKPVAVVARGCEVRGIQRLAADHRVDRSRLQVIGVPCRGSLDARKVEALGLGPVGAVREEAEEVVLHLEDGERRLPRRDFLLSRCLTCDARNPEDADQVVGEPVDATPYQAIDYGEVDRLEAMPPEERASFWQDQFSRCLRCYACRNVCPACSCAMCALESEEPRWLSRGTGPADQEMYHFIRATHVAGRCIDCHECERVCPQEIPLMLLNHKLLRDVETLFRLEAAHHPAVHEPLGFYQPDDPDEFH
ncbi:MAG: 4Fe-4S ferredoxin [Bacillota bacterium]